VPLTRDALAGGAGTVTHHVDDRWTMAYAAAIDEGAIVVG
jgi:hypothetical protein